MEQGLAASSVGTQTYNSSSNTVTHSYGGTVDKGKKKVIKKNKPKNK